MKPVLYSVLPRPPHPARDGLAIRNFYILRALAEEFRVRCLALLPPHLSGAGEYPPGVEVEEVRQAGRIARRMAAAASSLFSRDAFPALLYRSNALQEKLRALVDREKPAWVVAHSYHVAPMALAAASPAWVDFHNVDSEIWRRMEKSAASGASRPFLAWQAPRIERLEREIARRAAGISCVSSRDAHTLRQAGAREPLVVPNGVDLERYVFREETSAEDFVFFVGDLAWLPNVEGIAWFCGEVWPRLSRLRPSARAGILGRGAPESLRRFAGVEKGEISLLGEGRDTREYWRRAAVAVVPLLSGGGTRLKILEAAACGVPVVSTSVGAEGLDFAAGREILLADSPDAFASGVASLLGDREARLRQAAAARARVEAQYGWEEIGRRFATELVARARP